MNSSEERKTYTFETYGHPNILAKHVKTLEFTKDSKLTEKGDCIVGIKADFDIEKLNEFSKKVKFILSVEDEEGNEHFSIHKCVVNSKFKSDDELVLRKSFFDSDRTYGFKLDRGANRVDRKMVELMQNPKQKMKVTIMEGWY